MNWRPKLPSLATFAVVVAYSAMLIVLVGLTREQERLIHEQQSTISQQQLQIKGAWLEIENLKVAGRHSNQSTTATELGIATYLAGIVGTGAVPYAPLQVLPVMQASDGY